MKMNFYIKLVLALAFASAINAQEKQLSKAENQIESYAYHYAIESYENLVEDGYTDMEIYKNLGDANYQNAKYGEAASWYEKLIAEYPEEIDKEYLFRYAQSLKSIGEYDKSDNWMIKFEQQKAEDLRAVKFARQIDYLEKIRERSDNYQIEIMPINSTASDFAPSVKGAELVFSSARDTGIVSRNVHAWNNKPFLNLFKVVVSDSLNSSDVKKLSKNLNRKTHESSTVFTNDGQTVYFTRNNSENGNFKRDGSGVSRLKIYKADLIDGEWSNISELPFNSDSYSVAHPAVSPDNTKLYFASDMEGSKGASDIFVVDINADGTYGIPRNLGTGVNTEARETFPFISASNVLYFASDGHPGLGGLDVFAIDLNRLEENYVVNLGKPINSEQDDFSLVIDESLDKGYFASNREGGMGGDDIYAFTRLKPLKLKCTSGIQGITKEKGSGEPLTGVMITLFDEEGDKIGETTSASDGTFNFEADCSEKEQKIVGRKAEYSDGTLRFISSPSESTQTLEVLMEKQRAEVGTDLAKVLNLNPIYFDLNKAKIRPDAALELDKVVAYLKEYASVKIEVGSHTDSRGRDSYNLSLSDKRAKSTVNYIISKGIDASRISGKGYGESKLTNQCGNGVKCSKEEHELNRRSEFVVVD